MMRPIQVMPGDIACTTYTFRDDDRPSMDQLVLSCGIRLAQRYNDVDGKARLTHALVITDTQGTTFEALWRYRSQNLFEAYAGREILIGRHKGMTPERFAAAHRKLYPLYAGRKYPAWKLPLFLFTPRTLKYLPGKPVCSELSLRYWYEAGLVDHWRGVTPSYLADMIRNWRDIKIICS